MASFLNNINIFFGTAFHYVAYDPNVFLLILKYTFDF